MHTTLRFMLATALRGHSVSFSESGEWFLLERSNTSIKIEKFIRRLEPELATLVLQVTVRAAILGENEIIECFAGIGGTVEEAEKDAFNKFLMGSFHVILEALVPHSCSHAQAEIEIWKSPLAAWRVYSGPLLSQHSSTSVLSPDYGAMLNTIQTLFERSQSKQPHWVRFFIGVSGGTVRGGEVLLDNETWETAEKELFDFPWKTSAEYQSLRHFLLAIPLEESV